MVASDRPRRSGRERKRKRYVADPLEDTELLSDASPTEQAADESEKIEESQSEVSDFSVDKGEDEEISLDAELEEGGEHDDETLNGVTRPSQRGDIRRRSSTNPATEANLEPNRTPHKSTVRDAESGGTYRQIFEQVQPSGKAERVISMFGTGEEDHAFIIKSRDQWGNLVTLPQRDVNNSGKGGFRYGCFQDDDLREEQRIKDWLWYDDGGGKEIFQSHQVTKQITPNQADPYIPGLPESSYNFLIGPNKGQVSFGLNRGGSLNIGEAWDTVYKKHAATAPQAAQRSKEQREGWILNAGERVQSLGWAPNRDDDENQYLALTTTSFNDNRLSSGNDTAQSVSRAYSPSGPQPCSIQIWSVSSCTATSDKGRIAMETSPKLRQLLCFEWGIISQLQWCPAPKASSDDRDTICLGLLACISSDGYVRVLDVQLKTAVAPETEHVHVSKVAFASRPPMTMCTCVTWLSSSHLAVGCANGHAAVWDLSECLTKLQSNPHPDTTYNPRASFYQPLHQSYILSITSTYPSYPSYIATSSADGYVRLTSLSNPHSDTAVSIRTRVGSPTIAWCDHVQSLLCPEENNGVRAFPIRRMYSILSICRNAATVTSLATSPCHPCVLMASEDGTVSVTCPTRKVLLTHKAHVFVQVWFGHEWASKSTQGREDPASEPPERANSGAPDGASRFTEGYRVTESNLLKNIKSSALPTIYEERTAVTSIAWNPNVRCGGWAAAGMGSGLVRIEDLAL
ncbi:MAG: hypothetical protein M4579_000626 [Chaenotheca gracillima]|nr:MAG: hypothetical protein M4579_000626 [Chaenotheca gracillima]